MGKRKNDTLSWSKPFREYRRICWVSTEGLTEKDRFQINVFKRGDSPSVRFPRNVYPDRRNPIQVMKRFEKAMKTEDFRSSDEAWLIVDVDTWDREELHELLRWQEADLRHHLAVSNPKFEIFLLMYFERAGCCTTSQKIDAAIKRHMSRYDKRLGPMAFDVDSVGTAIENARIKRTAGESDLPMSSITDAHRLAERLLSREFSGSTKVMQDIKTR